MKYYLESLGCPKNLVDAHGMARLLKRLGHMPVSEPEDAQVLIVNTCGFINDAREESIDELQTLAQGKRPDQRLIAAGCLSQRWGQALADEVPGIDALLGTRRWSEIDALIQELAEDSPQVQGAVSWRGDPALDAEPDSFRVARQGASAYLKIADGCSAPCAFCAIPLIKGPAASRPAAEIVRDAADLVGGGVKELILIAQDTTSYGRDLGERDALPSLIEQILDAAPAVHWLRLMYAYPGHVSSHLIEVMANDPRVCRYLDLPLQHGHPEVLRRMKRPARIGRTRRLVSDLRAAMPDLSLRTSFIVGYPGETEREFETLLEFVEEMRFDRVGVFTYSPEEGTAAFGLPDSVPEEVKAERRDRLMALQQHHSLEANQAQVGRVLDVLIEGHGEGLSVGRSYRDAPEIDGLVLMPGELAVGQILPVHITGAMEYDLVGEVIRRQKRP
jgi:ribosomal protein S12 methylthiotransferase